MELGLPSTGTTGARRGRSRLQPGPRGSGRARAGTRPRPARRLRRAALRLGRVRGHAAVPQRGRVRRPALSGLPPDVAPLLLERGVAGVAVDTLSLDHGGSRDFAFHLAWLGAGRWGLECAANLGALPPTGATIVGGRRGSRAAPAGRAARWRSCDARPTETAATAPVRPRRRSAPSAAPASAPQRGGEYRRRGRAVGWPACGGASPGSGASHGNAGTRSSRRRAARSTWRGARRPAPSRR